MEQFHGYQHDAASGFYFPEAMPEGARKVIADAHRTGARLRIFTGDAETGRAFADEFEIIGRVGRSMGPCKVPLLIERANARGGGPISASVVAIQSAPGRFVWQLPGFHVGDWRVIASDMPDYAEAVTHDGDIAARFKKPGAAARYVAFMRGERWAK